MSTMLKLLLFVVIIVIAGYIGCNSCTKVSGTDISENMSSPYLSNGQANQQYYNSYRACNGSCARTHKNGILNTKNCSCNCI